MYGRALRLTRSVPSRQQRVRLRRIIRAAAERWRQEEDRALAAASMEMLKAALGREWTPLRTLSRQLSVVMDSESTLASRDMLRGRRSGITAVESAAEEAWCFAVRSAAQRCAVPLDGVLLDREQLPVAGRPEGDTAVRWPPATLPIPRSRWARESLLLRDHWWAAPAAILPAEEAAELAASAAATVSASEAAAAAHAAAASAKRAAKQKARAAAAQAGKKQAREGGEAIDKVGSEPALRRKKKWRPRAKRKRQDG